PGPPPAPDVPRRPQGFPGVEISASDDPSSRSRTGLFGGKVRVRSAPHFGGRFRLQLSAGTRRWVIPTRIVFAGREHVDLLFATLKARRGALGATPAGRARSSA